MIQIRNKNLDQIASEWWDNINEKLKSKEKIPNTKPVEYRLYKSSSLIERLKQHSTQTNDLGVFCSFLLDERNNYKLLKEIIVSNPKKLQDIITKAETKKSELNKLEIEYKGKFDEIFAYEAFTEKNGYWLAQKLGVNVCPYCNRQYTFTIGSDKDKGTRPEFDHFFDKATYPYLALSFYNLVPSCHICNSNLKGSEKFELKTHISPYVEGFENDLKFTTGYTPTDKNRDIFSDFEIYFKEFSSDTLKIERARRNIEVFRLKDLYNQHKDIVIELIQKKQTNAKEHIQNIHKQFPNLFDSLEDVQRMVLGNYISEEDLGKRPLAKLTRDISEELGLL